MEVVSPIPIEHCVSISGQLFPTPSFPQFVPCSCVHGCDVLACDCVLQHGGSAYNTDGTLKNSYMNERHAPIIECSKFCSCSADCFNKTSQNGAHSSLYIDNTVGKGRGVYTRERLKQGTFLCEYVGQLIKLDEYNTRLKEASNCYAMKLVEHLYNGLPIATCVDATYYSNISRWFNHSCSPNVVVVAVRSDSIVPRLCLFTCVPVEERVELCFSYCNVSTVADVGNVKCMCNSQKCRGYLPLQK